MKFHQMRSSLELQHTTMAGESVRETVSGLNQIRNADAGRNNSVTGTSKSFRLRFLGPYLAGERTIKI
jgi:hypothetical protein